MAMADQADEQYDTGDGQTPEDEQDDPHRQPASPAHPFPERSVWSHQRPHTSKSALPLQSITHGVLRVGSNLPFSDTKGPNLPQQYGSVQCRHLRARDRSEVNTFVGTFYPGNLSRVDEDSVHHLITEAQELRGLKEAAMTVQASASRP